MLALALFALSAVAQNPSGTYYVEASGLTMIGKLMPDTPNPYHRVDTVRFKGFTSAENNQVRMSSGLAVAFRTNSKSIKMKTEYGHMQWPMNASGIAARGYDLYIRKDGRWIYAAAGVRGDRDLDKELSLISNLDGSMHECLLYFPLYAEEYSVKIGVEEGSVVEAIPNPFRHRVAIFGSSYTHGSSTGRSGMTYPAQFTRMTGIQLLSLGCSGNSKLQDYFANVLAASDVDAFLFDSFSNPTPEQMETRLFPFIEKIQAAHPGVPLIFQKTIYREGRNFNTVSDKSEQDKMDMADSLMKIAVRKYKDVYYIRPNASDPNHEAQIDGVHPDNYGYTLWARSIVKPVKRILKKYGIR
jgi:hypothetical protein